MYTRKILEKLSSESLCRQIEKAEIIHPSMGEKAERGTGWIPPFPDHRDYSEGHAQVAPLLKAMDSWLLTAKEGDLPVKVDLTAWCSPIEDQGGLGSCTANAVAGVLEYSQKRAFDSFINASRLFTYKTSRNLMQVNGDVGSWMKTAMASLVIFGTLPEKYMKYHEGSFDIEPTAFQYSMAKKWSALKYFRHDTLSMPQECVLGSVKKHLAAGLPAMFGFLGYESFNNTETQREIPYPGPGEEAQWAHAVVAVGYDDARRITNTKHNIKTKGALLIRNSWGDDWGHNGYGWLPYRYVNRGLAWDFWSLIEASWIDTGQFGLL